MIEIPLRGCRTEPLGSYLQGLGMWRAVVRTVDRDARAHWKAGQLILTTAVGLDELIETLLVRFTPLPIVSPWNSGSGFSASGTRPKADQALKQIRDTSDPRFNALRAAVLAGDTVVTDAYRRGWSSTGKGFWDKARKPDVVSLCRAMLPDEALDWIDVAVVLGLSPDGRTEATYNRMLGTGGNFGSQDLSQGYLDSAFLALADVDRSRRWLSAALIGDETVPYQRASVGQFDPGRAGGVQSSIFEKADEKGFSNPWSFLLAVEGVLLFASAVVRRQGSTAARAAVPFLAPRVSTVGFSSSAIGEDTHAEVWMPEWDRPASLTEITHLLGEGRADWRGSPARTGLDFACAVGNLGVDRGIRAFTRYVIAKRLGQNPLAVAAGRVQVADRSLGLLVGLDGWLNRLRGSELTRGVESALRQVDGEMYELAISRTPNSTLGPALLAVGRLHQAVASSSAARERVRTPLVLGDADSWWRALHAESVPTSEMRLAVGLASASDGSRNAGPSLRELLTPVAYDARGRLQWVDRPSLIPATDIVSALAAAHQRRSTAGTVSDPLTGDETAAPAVRGPLSAYRRAAEVPVSDIVNFVVGRADDRLLHDYLYALMLLDWSDRLPDLGRVPLPVLPPELALLLPFFAARRLRVRLRDPDALPEDLVLRHGERWIGSLRADRVDDVAADAIRRLRAAGVRHPVTSTRAALGGERLAAGLLVPVSLTERQSALKRIACLPTDPARVAPTGGTA